jgi:phosphoribosyl 1,2-cyclic phosphodiesterase
MGLCAGSSPVDAPFLFGRDDGSNSGQKGMTNQGGLPVGLYFKSLRSGSGGNCLTLWTGKTRLLFDCGLSPQWWCEDVLWHHVDPADIDALIVSHAHGDHINYAALRVMENYGVPVRCHKTIRRAIQSKGGGGGLRCFSDRPFRVGEFKIQPFPLPHGDTKNYGFAVTCRQGKQKRKVVVATDLTWGEVAYFTDADFIFVEANHDPELRKRVEAKKGWRNANSRNHFSNAKAGSLLHYAARRSRFAPKAVMLGHLSGDYNTAALAKNTVMQIFRDKGHRFEAKLYVASQDKATRKVTISG